VRVLLAIYLVVVLGVWSALVSAATVSAPLMLLTILVLIVPTVVNDVRRLKERRRAQ
jgi:hypothetical protein